MKPTLRDHQKKKEKKAKRCSGWCTRHIGGPQSKEAHYVGKSQSWDSDPSLGSQSRSAHNGTAPPIHTEIYLHLGLAPLPSSVPTTMFTESLDA